MHALHELYDAITEMNDRGIYTNNKYYNVNFSCPLKDAFLVVPFPLSILYCSSICFANALKTVEDATNSIQPQTPSFHEATGWTNHTKEIQNVCMNSFLIHVHYFPVYVVEVYPSLDFEWPEKDKDSTLDLKKASPINSLRPLLCVRRCIGHPLATGNSHFTSVI